MLLGRRVPAQQLQGPEFHSQHQNKTSNKQINKTFSRYGFLEEVGPGEGPAWSLNLSTARREEFNGRLWKKQRTGMR